MICISFVIGLILKHTKSDTTVMAVYQHKFLIISSDTHYEGQHEEIGEE